MPKDMMLQFFINSILPVLNFLVLFLTLSVLVWYAWDTHRIANQTIEVNLRPVLLRSGWIVDWKIQSVEDSNETGKLKFIEFTNQKNIAKDIIGHLIIEGKKYILLFGNEVSQEIVSADENASVTKVGVAPKWGWLPAGGKLYATFEKEKFEETAEPNQVYLEYKDIEGNSYFTKEDDKFSQTSGRI